MAIVQTWLEIWTEEPIDESMSSARFRIDSKTARLNVGYLAVPTSQLKGWDGYYLGLAGPNVEQPGDTAPWWQLTFDYDPLTIETWKQATFKAGSPLYAQVLWTPEDGVEKSIAARRDGWTETDLADAARALKLLHGRAGAGRPFGSREDDPDPDFPQRYAEAYWKLFDLHDQRPNQAGIASELGIDKTTLIRRKKRYPVPKTPPRPSS
jgi:hypothetical protein